VVAAAEAVLTVEKKDTFLGNARMQDLLMEAVEETVLAEVAVVEVVEVMEAVEVVVAEEEVVITVVNKATFLGNVQMQDQEMEVVEETDLVVKVEVVAVDVIEKVEVAAVAVVVILADRQDIFHESAHKQQEETEDRTRKVSFGLLLFF